MGSRVLLSSEVLCIKHVAAEERPKVNNVIVFSIRHTVFVRKVIFEVL